MFGDFLLLNIIIWLIAKNYWLVGSWPEKSLEIFILVNNIALMLSQTQFSTIIHERFIGAGDVIKRVIELTILQSILAYLLLKVFDYSLPVGWMQFAIGTLFFVLLLLMRLIERWFIKLYREAGRNTRSVVLVGNDPELIKIYKKLSSDLTTGYRVLGYYADSEIGHWTYAEDAQGEERIDETTGKSGLPELRKLGTLQYFLTMMRENPEALVIGDELYASISRKDRSIIKRISQFCDHKVIRFFYVPVSVESIGLNLKPEMIDDIEVFTTYDNPLQRPLNRIVKRVFDIAMSILFLIPTAILFPFVFLIIKIQSPGPVFFKQARTGIDGRTFMMYKFRSMHVNKDADKLQATKDDPRKFPFGNLMRKTNIDELPQFINVLKGDMSIVGPRPHMLAHTEQYSELIDKYMVRHFVKPGLTGWAQVTGYRGETKELWQMEGRVKRDIWYIEHWSVWLDIRIIWMTVKTIFVHDKNAY